MDERLAALTGPTAATWAGEAGEPVNVTGRLLDSVRPIHDFSMDLNGIHVRVIQQVLIIGVNTAKTALIACTRLSPRGLPTAAANHAR